MKLEFSGHIIKKLLKYQILLKSVQLFHPDGWTGVPTEERTDRQT